MRASRGVAAVVAVVLLAVSAAALVSAGRVGGVSSSLVWVWLAVPLLEVAVRVLAVLVGLASVGVLAAVCLARSSQRS